MLCEPVLADGPVITQDADDMAWTKPLNSRGKVDLAGDVISGRKTMVPRMDLDTALGIVGN
jgi:hypothetical protein